MTVLVNSRVAVWVAWKRLPSEIRSQIKAHHHPRGTFLTPLGPLAESWVTEQVRRFGECEWRRGAWRVTKRVTEKRVRTQVES